MPQPQTMLGRQAAKALYRALDAEIGVKYRTVHPISTEIIAPSQRARQILYRFRREIGDPSLLSIQIRLSKSDPDHTIYLIRGNNGEEDDEP